MTRIEKVPNSG